MQKTVHFGEFWKPEACGQTVLPDRSILIEQKLVENAKIQNFKCDIFSHFQTLCNILCNVLSFMGECIEMSYKHEMMGKPDID